jgi:tetratricopeptide (TPR) repeat protein
MTPDELVHIGNNYRNSTEPAKALECYAQAFIAQPENIHAWNNYGNVLREMGEPKRAIPFLQHAIALDETYVTAQFNLSVAYLLAGDLHNGFKQYEWRWQYEHLAGTLPQLDKPMWEGQDLRDKKILVLWEQGLGDTIQFVRFFKDLHNLGAKVLFHTHVGMCELFHDNPYVYEVSDKRDDLTGYDYYITTMSLARVLNVTLDNLDNSPYIVAQNQYIEPWRERLGAKTKMRVGVCWSGRKDSWINQHKGMHVNTMLQLINARPEIEWINLLADANDEEAEYIFNSSMRVFPSSIRHWGDTAGLLHHLDLVISVDTAIAHLAGAMGKPLWIPLNNFAVDWRYLLDTALHPWYNSARIFRQPKIGDWDSVLQGMHLFLDKVKI